jgi:hypothetical protein
MRTEHAPHPVPFGLSHDAHGRLVLIDAGGRRFVGVEPVRAFPITHPTRWISICDAEGHEILTLASLDDLPPPLRQTLEEELSLREFIPVIRRLVRVSADAFPADWEVETDRGPARFTVDAEDDVRRFGPSRVMIADARRVRYQIPDVAALDLQSRKILERFL